MESVWVRVYFPDTNQGLIYGWKHCPTPANLQHISGTPPAILDFLVLYPPFRCEDHLIIWFIAGEFYKKPRTSLKKNSHLKTSAPSWGLGFWDRIPRAWQPPPLEDIPFATNIKMRDTSAAFPRYPSNTGWYICCDVYNAPKNIQQ